MSNLTIYGLGNMCQSSMVECKAEIKDKSEAQDIYNEVTDNSLLRDQEALDSAFVNMANSDGDETLSPYEAQIVANAVEYYGGNVGKVLILTKCLANPVIRSIDIDEQVKINAIGALLDWGMAEDAICDIFANSVKMYNPTYNSTITEKFWTHLPEYLKLLDHPEKFQRYTLSIKDFDKFGRSNFYAIDLTQVLNENTGEIDLSNDPFIKFDRKNEDAICSIIEKKAIIIEDANRYFVDMLILFASLDLLSNKRIEGLLISKDVPERFKTVLRYIKQKGAPVNFERVIIAQDGRLDIENNSQSTILPNNHELEEGIISWKDGFWFLSLYDRYNNKRYTSFLKIDGLKIYLERGNTFKLFIFFDQNGAPKKPIALKAKESFNYINFSSDKISAEGEELPVFSFDYYSIEKQGSNPAKLTIEGVRSCNPKVALYAYPETRFTLRNDNLSFSMVFNGEHGFVDLKEAEIFFTNHSKIPLTISAYNLLDEKPREFSFSGYSFSHKGKTLVITPFSEIAIFGDAEETTLISPFYTSPYNFPYDDFKLRTSINTVSIIEEAEVPTRPYGIQIRKPAYESINYTVLRNLYYALSLLTPNLRRAISSIEFSDDDRGEMKCNFTSKRIILNSGYPKFPYSYRIIRNTDDPEISTDETVYVGLLELYLTAAKMLAYQLKATNFGRQWKFIPEIGDTKDIATSVGQFVYLVISSPKKIAEHCRKTSNNFNKDYSDNMKLLLQYGYITNEQYNRATIMW